MPGNQIRALLFFAEIDCKNMNYLQVMSHGIVYMESYQRVSFELKINGCCH
jgi:hypothetical protein